jgi:hypothetical protein
MAQTSVLRHPQKYLVFTTVFNLLKEVLILTNYSTSKNFL